MNKNTTHTFTPQRTAHAAGGVEFFKKAYRLGVVVILLLVRKGTFVDDWQQRLEFLTFASYVAA